MNPFDVSSTTYAGTVVNAALQSQGITPTITLSSNDSAFNVVNTAAKKLKAAITGDNTLNSTVLENIGFTISNMLVSCYFNDKECDESDFKLYRTNEYGNCYTFNYDASNPVYTSRTGPNSGLTMEVFLGVPGFFSSDFYFASYFSHII